MPPPFVPVRQRLRSVAAVARPPPWTAFGRTRSSWPDHFRCPRQGSTLGVVRDEREQNWYPIGKVGWFTQHIREGIEVTAEQLRLLQPALPGRTSSMTPRGPDVRVHEDRPTTSCCSEPGDKWSAMPGLTRPARRRPRVRGAIVTCGVSTPRCWLPRAAEAAHHRACSPSRTWSRIEPCSAAIVD